MARPFPFSLDVTDLGLAVAQPWRALTQARWTKLFGCAAASTGALRRYLNNSRLLLVVVRLGWSWRFSRRDLRWFLRYATVVRYFLRGRICKERFVQEDVEILSMTLSAAFSVKLGMCFFVSFFTAYGVTSCDNRTAVGMKLNRL